MTPQDQQDIIAAGNRVAARHNLTVEVKFHEVEGSDSFFFKWLDSKGERLAEDNALLETLGIEVLAELPESWREDTMVMSCEEYEKFRMRSVRKMVNGMLDEGSPDFWRPMYTKRRLEYIMDRDAKALLAVEIVWLTLLEEYAKRKKT